MKPLFLMLRRHRDYALLIANLAIRALFVFFPFWGLEYEDSFIYNDTGRYINYDYDFHAAPFKAQSCVDGSFEKCNEYVSYAGHFLTFPYLISRMNLLVGYHVSNAFVLNFFFSTLLLLAVFVWNKKNKESQDFSLTGFLLLMLFTPFVTIFHTSGLAETLSSLLVMLTVIFYGKANKNDFKIADSATWLALILLLGAVATKRENILLLVLFFLFPILRFVKREKILTRNYCIYVIISLFAVASFSYAIDLFVSEANEGADIGTATFSLVFLAQNLQQAFLAILEPSYWGLTGFMFMISIVIVAFKRKSCNGLTLVTLVLSCLYALLYSSHYRSYYQVHYNNVDPFETLRYSINYFPLIAIFISSIDFRQLLDSEQVRAVFRPVARFLPSIGVLAFVVLLYNSISNRVAFSSDEYYSRIEPVKETLNSTKEGDVIITDIPIVFHCYVSSRQRIVDYYSMSREKLKNIISNETANEIYLIKSKVNKEDSVRYQVKFDLKKYHITRIKIKSEHYELIKIGALISK